MFKCLNNLALGNHHPTVHLCQRIEHIPRQSIACILYLLIRYPHRPGITAKLFLVPGYSGISPPTDIPYYGTNVIFAGAFWLWTRGYRIDSIVQYANQNAESISRICRGS